MGRQSIMIIADALPRAESCEARAVTTVGNNLMANVELLRCHIQKEDNVHFPKAGRPLPAEDQ